MSNNGGLAKRVMMFHIGCCSSRVLGDLLQQHPALHWDQLIKNFDEVSQALQNSPFEWMLWDGET